MAVETAGVTEGEEEGAVETGFFFPFDTRDFLCLRYSCIISSSPSGDARLKHSLTDKFPQAPTNQDRSEMDQRRDAMSPQQPAATGRRRRRMSKTAPIGTATHTEGSPQTFNGGSQLSPQAQRPIGEGVRPELSPRAQRPTWEGASRSPAVDHNCHPRHSVL